MIQKNPLGFLYFTQPTNKGTIQTVEILVTAKNEEELAAIWIAAISKELCDHWYENSKRKILLRCP